MHWDHGLPLVAVLWVFVVLSSPWPLWVSLLCLSFPGCNGGLTNAISHRVVTPGQKFTRKTCGKRAPTQVPVPPSFEATAKGPNITHALLLGYGALHYWRTWLLVPDSIIVFVFFFVAVPFVVLSSANCPEGQGRHPRFRRLESNERAPSRSKPLLQFGDRHHQDENHISIFW